MGLSNVLQFDQSAGSIGVATVTWDGVDSDDSNIPAVGGLGGLDLMADGGAAFSFLAGIDEAGAGETITLRVFSGDDMSTATANLPVTDGTALSELFVAFSEFTGSADFSSVDAIQAEFGGNLPSIDAQIGPIYVVGVWPSGPHGFDSRTIMWTSRNGGEPGPVRSAKAETATVGVSVTDARPNPPSAPQSSPSQSESSCTE